MCVPALSRTCRPGQTDVKNLWKSLGLLLAVDTLSAKDPPQPASIFHHRNLTEIQTYPLKPRLTCASEPPALRQSSIA
jgi:hypothetical protein